MLQGFLRKKHVFKQKKGKVMLSFEEQERRKRSYKMALFALDGPPDPGMIERGELVIRRDQHYQVCVWQSVMSSESSLSVSLTIEMSSETLFIEWA